MGLLAGCNGPCAEESSGYALPPADSDQFLFSVHDEPPIASITIEGEQGWVFVADTRAVMTPDPEAEDSYGALPSHPTLEGFVLTIEEFEFGTNFGTQDVKNLTVSIRSPTLLDHEWGYHVAHPPRVHFDGEINGKKFHTVASPGEESPLQLQTNFSWPPPSLVVYASFKGTVPMEAGRSCDQLAIEVNVVTGLSGHAPSTRVLAAS